MESREHRRDTSRDVIKVCSGCDQEKPHYWIIDKRRKITKGYVSSHCRECKAVRERRRRKHKAIRKPPERFQCRLCNYIALHDWIADIRNTEGGYYRAHCQECQRTKTADAWWQIKCAAVEYLGGKCVDCGLKDSCMGVYDFHHRNPSQKSYSIGDLFKGKSARQLDDIKPELDKCDLLCANCHRRRHDQRRR